MTKIDINDVAAVLADLQFPSQTVTKVISELQAKAEAAKEERGEPKPKGKNQFVVVLSDPEGTLEGRDYVGWVLQMESEAPPQAAIDRVKAAAVAFNQSRKGRKHPVTTVGEAMEGVSRKFWKTDDPAVKTLVKTKTPVLIQVSNNRL